MNINASMNTDENNLTEVQETNNNQCEYSLEELNKELSAKCESLEDQLKRTLADYQNLLRRTSLERESMSKYGAESTVKALISTLDNFYYAWQSPHGKQSQSDPVKFLESLKMLYENMRKSLETIGVGFIEPASGENFDANRHEAIMTLPANSSACPEGTIAQILTPGYSLHDRVIKHAQVAIAVAVSSQEQEIKQETKQEDNRNE